MTIDELQVLITAETGNFNKQINGVKGQINSLSTQSQKSGQTISDSFSKVGNAGVKTLQVGVLGAIGAIAASIPGAVKRIDTLVAFPRVLKAMGASADDASQSTQRLVDHLTGLPTPLQDGASGVQALVAAGLDVGKATDTFLSFNDATLAASTNSGVAQGAFEQLTKAISTGVIQADGWQSIVTAMPTAFKALSNETGKSTTELQALYRTNPQKLLDDLSRLDKEGGGGLASLTDQAKAATGGIGTAFDNMKNAIARGIQGIVTALGSGDLAAGQKRISDAITAIGKAFGDGLLVVGSFFTFVMDHSSIFGTIAAAIAGVVTAMTAWTIVSEAVAIAQAALNVVLTANPIGIIIVAIAALVAGLIYLWNTSDGFRNFFIDMWNSFVTAIQPVITVFTTLLLPALQMVWGFIVTQFQQAWNNLQAAFIAVQNALAPLIDKVQFFMPVLKALGIAVVVAVIAPLVLLVGAIVAVITIIAVVVGVIANFIGWLAKLSTQLIAVATLIITTVVSNFRNAWNTISGIWSGVAGFFSGVVRGIGNAFNSLPSTVRALFNRVVSTITSINWGDIGTNIIKGIGNGIAGMGGWLADQAKAAVGGAKDALKSFLGIHSPSRVMRDEVGKMMGLGVAEGIVKSSSMVVKSAQDMSNDAINAASGHGNLSFGTSGAMKGLEVGGSSHITVKIGEETLVDRIVKGINNKSFMTNGTIIEV